MSSIKKDISKLEKENKDLLKSIDAASASLKNPQLNANQQILEVALMMNATKQLQENINKIRILKDVQGELKQMQREVNAEAKGTSRKSTKEDLRELTVPQVQNFATNTVQRPRRIPKNTPSPNKERRRGVRF